MIERAGGEIPTVGDCERASKIAEAAIQAAGAEPGDFEFEVESPGADRPLTRPEDYVRFAAEQVTVTLYEAREDGRRNFTGRLIGEQNGDVTVHVLDETEPQTFAKNMIREVRLHPEMKFKPAEPDGGKRGKHGKHRR
jgi:ribosome maturation factor RimP